MRFATAALAVLLAAPGLADTGGSEQWYVGYLNGSPALRGREVLETSPEGVVSRFDLDLILLRPARIEIRQSERFEEDAQGKVLGFTFDHDEGGQRTVAVGKVGEDEVAVTVYRLGRESVQHLALPDDAPLAGQRLSQILLAQAPESSERAVVFYAPQLLQGEVVLARTTAHWIESPSPGRRLFEVTSDLVPLPVLITVDPEGRLLEMKLSFGPFSLELVPTDSPPALLGAEIPPTGLVDSVGPPPRIVGPNRYRLPPALQSRLPQDEFQRLHGEILEVRPEAPVATLPDPEPFLRATPQLELDDPELRAWVASAIQGAEDVPEALRLAVRSHIVRKDLSKGDASALETFRDRQGDCTEHANLLAAALRIAKIPSRIEVGFVWAPDYGGWVGHAWNSAYDATRQRWIHLDAAYPGLPRSLYVKLASLSQLDAAGTGTVLASVFGSLLGEKIETLPPTDPEVAP